MKFTYSIRTSMCIAVLTLLLSISSFAQAPEKMSYQAVIRDAANVLVTNQQLGMQISILQEEEAVYKETQTPTSNANGLVSLAIGEGTVISGSFTAINWSAATSFIKIETDPTGGTNYTITGTTQLLSVPYALYAKTSSDAPAIAANTEKTGITSEQAIAIAANSEKVGYTELAVSENPDVTANTAKLGLPVATATGQMNYWNGVAWVTLAPGEVGATLKMESEGVLAWVLNMEEVIPSITSGITGINLAENSGAGQTVYTIIANSNNGGTIANYAIAGTDAALLLVNATTGVVTLTANPDYEIKPSYSFTVNASDLVTTSSAKNVTFFITNADDTIPTITSGTTGTNLAENSGAGQTIYTITAAANDGGTIASYAIAGTDAAELSVNATTGVVTLAANPDYETKASYSFTAIASDATATSNALAVTCAITNADDTIPTITSGTAGTNLAENSGAGQTVYTITANANDGGTIASYAIAGTDAAELSVNATTGVVTLAANPDFETKASYSFTVTASDAIATSSAIDVTFSITNVYDAIPTITSGPKGINIRENSGAGQTIYTITAAANDGDTILSYAIGGTDAAELSVDATTGVVTLAVNPDYETKASYSFTVTASDAIATSAPFVVTFFINTYFYVGMEAAGGKVFYILNSSDPGYDPELQHGLVHALEKLPAVPWDNGSDHLIGITSTAAFTGSANTDAIIASHGTLGTASAASVARAYNGGGYSDWFLPSLYELYLLGGQNLPYSTYYWSSSEDTSNPYKAHSMATYYTYSTLKSTPSYVLPFRAF